MSLFRPQVRQVASLPQQPRHHAEDGHRSQEPKHRDADPGHPPAAAFFVALQRAGLALVPLFQGRADGDADRDAHARAKGQAVPALPIAPLMSNPSGRPSTTPRAMPTPIQ